MGFLVFVLGVAVTTAVIGTSKNRSFFGWLTLGLFFSLFALIAVCAMPALRERKYL
ncbi:hypothetical protein [Pseudovibrio sp. WM33]|uniref:hypothetical protein n=1 Tax=Pseudovibrio sp. WM33 TaxID=1735585 RepID=UPI0007B17C9C|nr:hypothetical protein [Pseudovibrio sp. WM33]KZL26058.1 hypothetical protein PsWM33_01583 [Pseudovibrio sp. WM33]